MTSPEILGESHGSTTGSLIDNGRFAPGTVLAGRYRIVELLGRGGMGEVYRVDDLKLGQPISLKFLTIDLAQQPAGLNTLYQEARSARLVGHQNVCRVFDVGELDGLPFISMEYVDGENLKSLLSRIGRVPHDKAIEIARQLCRGLHAIHEQGLLHRDLKPTNVMVDGRGRARITDFGLAAAAQDLAGSSNRAGTPAYMAPEQLVGRAVTVRSDLYSLGLILYELFTGKRVFTGQSWAEFSRLHQDEEPTPPSSVVHNFDPAVERVIMQCLEKDPGRRPASAMAVLGALSGGDMLAAVLAAGETPTPEMVAAAQTREGIAPAVAVGAFVAVVASVLAIAAINDAYSPVRHAKLNLPPAVLEDRAREIIARLGYPRDAVDWKSEYRLSMGVVPYIEKNDPRPDRWQQLDESRYPLLGFWYRQSNAPLIASNAFGVVSWDDPPPVTPGMIGVSTDTQGALLRFYAAPLDFEPNQPSDSLTLNWSEVFALAKLDAARFRPETPQWTPTVYSSARQAWVETQPEPNVPPLRVEAGAHAGRVNYVSVVGPWTRPQSLTQLQPRVFQVVVGVLILVLMGSGLVLAVHNIRQGRGDRRGGLTVTIVMFVFSLATWIVTSDHAGGVGQLVPSLVSALGQPFFYAVMFWIMYMALEPTVRRRWPHRLVGWSRLVQGRWGDPVVGRDVLIGIGFGCLSAVVVVLYQVAPTWFGMPPASVDAMLSSVRNLTPVRIVQVLLSVPVVAVFNALIAVYIPLLFFIILRREWLAAVLSFMLWIAIMFLADFESQWVLPLIQGVLLGAIWTVVALRYGLLAMTLTFMTMFLLQGVSLTLDASLWYAATVDLAAVAVVGLAAAATYVSLGGRPLLKGSLLDA